MTSELLIAGYFGMAFFDLIVRSPLSLQNQWEFKTFVDFKDNLYIINEKLLCTLLEKLGYLGDYSEFQTHNSTQNIKTWLKEKKLYSFEIIESICDYKLTTENERTNIDSIKFTKKDHLTPKISSNDFKIFFERALIQDFISKNEEAFNDFILREIRFIEKEFSTITDENILSKRKELYFKNFLSDATYEFIENHGDYSLREEFKNLDTLHIVNGFEAKLGEFSIYKTGVPTTRKNGKTALRNTKLVECYIGQDELELEIRKEGIGDIYSYLQWLLQIGAKLVNKQLEYDKRFFVNQLSRRKTPVTLSASIDNVYSTTALEDKINILEYCDNFDSQNITNSKSLQLLLLDRCYKKIETSNIILGSDSITTTSLAVLNLNSENISQLHSLELKPYYDFSASIVNNYAFDDFGLPTNGINFAEILI